MAIWRAGAASGAGRASLPSVHRAQQPLAAARRRRGCGGATMRQARSTDHGTDRQTSGEGRGPWLSINEACQLLGVDQSTLRRWSDAGKVPVFRTPGGHRRYAEADLRALVGEGAHLQERPRVSRQALTDRSLSAYEEEYLRAARDRRWYQALGRNTLEEHRRLGRRLVDLAVRYAAGAPGNNDRPSLLDEGKQIGEHY